MNKARRKMLKESILYLSKAMEMIESVRDEEEESLDSLPDSFAGSARATEMEDNIDALEEICENLEESVSGLSDIAN